jgi:hypothetical protein
MKSNKAFAKTETPKATDRVRVFTIRNGEEWYWCWNGCLSTSVEEAAVVPGDGYETVVFGSRLIKPAHFETVED